jgi:hypothetical protein
VKLTAPASTHTTPELDELLEPTVAGFVAWQPPATHAPLLKSYVSCVAHENAVSSVPAASAAAEAPYHVLRARSLSRGDLMSVGVPF